ncbi:MAG TPA: hypothetical protein VKD91_06870, partial [Pyrinomonadaceae bacterium]|nr:hypothetical protein [Pyrinomonadaceae bacterium]
MFGKAKTKRQPVLLGIILTLLASGFAAVGLARNHFGWFADSAVVSSADPVESQKTERAGPRFAGRILTQPAPSGSQYEVVRSLVAGGGGNSAGGQFELKGSAGQAAAGT